MSDDNDGERSNVTQTEERQGLLLESSATPKKTPYRRYGPLETPWRQSVFLKVLEKEGIVAIAARAVEIRPSVVREWRGKNETFDTACLDAIETFKEEAEAEGWRRATKGVRQYRFNKDGDVLTDPVTGEPYYEVVYSDRLLEFMLRGADPNKYADKRVHSGAVAVGLIPLGAIREALKGSRERITGTIPASERGWPTPATTVAIAANRQADAVK